VSVFKRSYRRYSGPIASDRFRLGVLMRYGAADLWGSRITNVLFVLCMVPALISMAVIYIMNNDVVRLLLSGQNGSGPKIAMDERFFFAIMQGQCWPALILIAWIGPKLIAGDLANDALPILLSHPISRTEYVLAKLAVLVGFLSVVTWVPMSLLFGFQSYVSAVPWAGEHLHILLGMFVGSLIWIILLSLISLSVASWVKWRIVATGLLFATVFVPAGVGTVFNAVMRTHWGNLINIPDTMETLWIRMLQVNVPAFYTRAGLPTTALLISLFVMCVLCVGALNARIRAREVVRG
jgi:ABC-type transport system involved in multi-copper enzyme maturation permease subunit